MRDHPGRGSVINTASLAADELFPGLAAYSLPKAAINMITAVEGGPHGVRVKAMARGMALTTFTFRHVRRPHGSVDPEELNAH